MRIVSLLPAATEIVCALGLGDQLVGVSHECDFPAETVQDLPVVTSSAVPSSGDASAGQIDALVRAARERGESLYQIDGDLLRCLAPDLMLTQGLCDVCAVTHQAVLAAVNTLGATTTVLDLAPTTLAGVLDTFRQIGAATGKEAEADALADRVRARWETVRERAASSAPEQPRTLLLEWPDPLFSAGHWNPELLTLAGGAGAPWDEPGKASRTLSWDEVKNFAPEMIVLIACGLDADQAIDAAFVLPDLPGWFDLPAVRQGECYALDGNAYFNRPGPRLAESAEILATVLHPETFTDMLPPYAVRRFGNDLLEPQEEEEAE